MIDVVMPQMGESIVEGTLTKWLKKPGERVERDEPLFEISTDKVDTEIPVARRRRAVRDPGGGRQDGRHQHRGRPDQTRAAAADTPAPADSSAACACRPRRRQLQPPVAPSRRTIPASPTPEPAACRRSSRIGGRTAVAAGAQHGSRIQHRPEAGERHRRRRPHHQAGSRRLHVGTGRRARMAPVGSAPPLRRHLAHAAAPAPPAATAARPAVPCPAPSRRSTRVEPMSNMRAEDRRAHGVQQAHLRARHHRAQGGHDARGEAARAQQGRSAVALRLLAHVPAVRHARGRRSPARVPHRERVHRGNQHHLSQRHQHRHRGGARRTA